eukprot:6488593-Amphidinium_carterae.1
MSGVHREIIKRQSSRKAATLDSTCNLALVALPLRNEFACTSLRIGRSIHSGTHSAQGAQEVKSDESCI